MSEQVNRNTDHQSSQEQQKKVLVSIVLSESMTSKLQLNVGESSSQAVTEKSTSSLYNLNKLFRSNNSLKKRRVWTDTAYFSSNLTDSLSSLEIDENADDVDNSCSSDATLKEVEIFTHSLLSFNSAAHEGSIDCERNNILSVLGRQQSSEWLNICRICHGGESNGNLLSPCHCRGSMALAHIECLESWLKESKNSHCELCRYHYTIVREPKYGILQSIFVFILHPGESLRDLVFDIAGFIMCTTVFSTYMLAILSASATRTTTHNMFGSPQIIEFSSALGMILIECVYTSWLLDSLKKYVLAWEAWYRTNFDLKVILSKTKQPVRYEVVSRGL